MKKILLIIVMLGAIFGVFYFINMKPAIAPAVIPPITTSNNPTELCFAKFGTPDKNDSYDIYTLRLIISGEKVTGGELNLVPAESNSKTGEIKGTVSVLDNATMTRTADLQWFTFAGGANTEKVKIILGNSTASVETGTSTLSLAELPCLGLIERTNVENYLSDNISRLSPVKAVLGGTWYVVYATIDLAKDSGIVKYEDGHIQETKNFSYTTNTAGDVTGLTIAGSNPVPQNSAITGTVSLGPTCPVERIPPDPACAPKPYATSINIMKTGSMAVIKTIESDMSGAFSVFISPGTYTLHAVGGNTLPRCTDITVAVKSGQNTITNISCDTGIR